MNPTIPSGTPSSTGTKPGHKFSLELLQDWPQRQTESGGFPKLGVPFLGVIIIRTTYFGVSLFRESTTCRVSKFPRFRVLGFRFSRSHNKDGKQWYMCGFPKIRNFFVELPYYARI